jgi:hypothetical protein
MGSYVFICGGERSAVTVEIARTIMLIGLMIEAYTLLVLFALLVHQVLDVVRGKKRD